MNLRKAAWVALTFLSLICASSQPALADPLEARGRVTWVGRHSIRFKCEAGSTCEGRRLKLALDDQTDLGDLSLDSIYGRQLRIEYEAGATEGTWRLLRVLEMILPDVVEATGTVTGVTRSQITFVCDAASACAGHTLTLDVADDADLNGFSVFYLSGKTVTLSYHRAGGKLVEIIGTQADDPRDSFNASVYTGLSIDSFAAGDLNRYLNPEESGDLRERAIAGFDFEYRLLGDSARVRQLWVYGQTVHGARSTDIDCSKTPDVPSCSDTFDAANPDVALFLIRNATSLEGFLGLRYEFAPLQKLGASPARAYLEAQAGFIAVSGDGKDVADVNALAVGAIAISGRYSGSFLEVGYGTSDLFVEKPNGRYKLDAMLTWHPRWLKTLGASPFAELTADVDLDTGADSLQTYIGIDFDLERLFGPKLPEKTH